MVSVAHSAGPYRPGPDPFADVFGAFTGASKQLVAGRELLRRIDSKYVVHAARLPELVARFASGYAALQVPGGNVARYHSLYFDSPELRCFHDHRRGRRIRHKIRIRHYPDREVSFLEVKSKRNEQVTDKRRLPIAYGEERLDARELAFLRQHAGVVADALGPEVYIDFRRVTLIGLDTNERITIDVDLEIVGLDGTRRSLGPIAILEVKQSPFSLATPVMRALVTTGEREQSMSKYVAAIVATRPDQRVNRLLPDLRAVERIGKWNK